MKNESNKKIFLLIFIAALLFAGGFAYSGRDVRAETAEDVQNKIDKYAKKLKEAEAELQTLNSQYYKNQTQINAAAALVKKLQDDIARREAELNNLKARAELNKEMLGEYIRKLYYADREGSAIRLAVFRGNMSDLVADPDGMVEIKAKIMDTLQAIEIAKGETEEVKSELVEKKQDSQEILQEKKTERVGIVADISETKATLADITSEINKLKEELSNFLGKPVSYKNIMDAAEAASKYTGVRKDFLMAMLTVESRQGTFTGGCTYAEVESGAQSAYKKGILSKKSWNTFQVRREVFKDICSDLDYDYKKKKVSCNPKSYVGTGGAMGVPQFMPTTWANYKSRIIAATHNNPPDPWSLADGVMAMALYLQDAGGTSKKGECGAAIRYIGANVAYTKNNCALIKYWSDSDNYSKVLN